MFQPWRRKLREAGEAYQAGRLDEACRLLSDEELRQFLPARKLLAKVAADMLARANAASERGDTSAGWRDLDAASYLGAQADGVTSLRESLLERAVNEAETLLAAGDADSAARSIETLKKRRHASSDVRSLEKAAQAVRQAERLKRQGQFRDAAEQYRFAAQLRPTLVALNDKAEACQRHVAEVRELGQQTHEAIAAEDWNRVVVAADRWLELAPESKLARDARRRAWAAVGMRASSVGTRVAAEGRHAERAETSCGPSAAAIAEPEGIVQIHCTEDDEVLAELVPHPRFVLWVDAVGGYLVCSGDAVTVGQPEGTGAADIPILGDISARHAIIRRAGEGYLINPLRETYVNGQRIDRVTTLVDGCEIQLGEAVRLRFRRPHALSATARLEFLSHHRTQPACDAVILMAESCVLGPGSHDHIFCEDWTEPVVLYRRDEELYCRSKTAFEVDGQPAGERQAVPVGSRVASDEFSMSLEAV